MKPLRVALVTTDGRELLRQYEEPQPILGTAPIALLQGLSDLPGVEVHAISCLRQPVVSPEKLGGNIWFHSLTVPKLGWLRTAYFGCIRAVRRRLQAIQPDIVHGQGTERECAMCAVWSGYPNVVTIHGLMSEMARLARARPGDFLWYTALLERHVLKRTAGVFCNSQFTESLVGPRAARIWRVPNPVRADFFSSPRSVARALPPLLLNVGTIGANKRQRQLLDVAGRLHQQGHRFSLSFVGHADPQDSCAADFLQQVREATQHGYARFEGLLLDEKLIEAYDKASALVHFPAVETFGLCVAEGLARGLKFFGNRCGGVVDVAADAEGAELFDQDDLDGLERELARWLKAGAPMPADPGANVRRRYLPRVIAERHLEIYQEVLQRSSQRRVP